MTANKTTGPYLDPSSSYVEQLETLQVEINRAISAIAENDVVALEQSLTEQEVLCSHLQSLMGLMVKNLDSSSARTVQTATSSLQVLVRTYHLLLQHAGGNAQQLYRLCRSYTA